MQFSEQHLIRSIREPNTTAGITQCHAATHTWPLSSPGLSRNRDKQHEICADSALHSPGLLQDRTQGWLASLRLSPVSNKVKEHSKGWHSMIVLSLNGIVETQTILRQQTSHAQTVKNLEKEGSPLCWVHASRAVIIC